jgi:hypothetical protein
MLLLFGAYFLPVAGLGRGLAGGSLAAAGVAACSATRV